MLKQLDRPMNKQANDETFSPESKLWETSTVAHDRTEFGKKIKNKNKQTRGPPRTVPGEKPRPARSGADPAERRGEKEPRRRAPDPDRREGRAAARRRGGGDSVGRRATRVESGGSGGFGHDREELVSDDVIGRSSAYELLRFQKDLERTPALRFF